VQELIEEYFATPAAGKRRGIVEQIEQVGLDANVVGRLTRVRLHWPELKGGGIFYVNEPVGAYGVHYFLGVPGKYERTKAWPLVIKLPTAQAFVGSPPPGVEGVVRIYAGWVKEEMAQHPDAVVLMPLLNLDELWGPSYAGMACVMQPLLHVGERVNIDPARVYLMGHSMSGHAVWNLALHYPTYFAAIGALAGAAPAEWQRIRLMNLRNVLPVVWHDADDKVVSMKESQALVEILRRLKVDVEYDQTRGVGHAPSAEVAERVYKTMRSRTRQLYPERVSMQSSRPDSAFSRADWVQVYDAEYPGKEQQVLLEHGTGRLTFNANSFMVDAVRSPLPLSNRIEIRADNVGLMRLYLNDQMIDFGKPLTVVVNKRVRFEGMVEPSIDEMLKDQVFVGRGIRYFGGIVELDLGGRNASATRPATRNARPSSRPHGTIEYLGPGESEIRRIDVK
jgi:pimeloyl-ACP methyl ester carboxylesterase